MTALAWDQTGEKIYETGVDRGVLYLSDGSGVPWNGLTSVDDKTKGSVTSAYWDGVKYADVYVHGDFEAVLKAYTYPDEFMEFEGVVGATQGFLIAQQTPKTFGLSYRTLIGNDVAGLEYGYKIHILCNLLAVPGTKGFRTQAKTVAPVEFEWTLSAVPAQIPGFRPSPHIIFDSTKSSPEFIEELEGILYGTESTDAELPTFEALLNMAEAWV